MTDTTATNLADVWAHAMNRMDETGLAAQHRAFLRMTKPIALVEDTAVIAVPNDFTKQIVETRMRSIICDVLSQEYKRELRIAVTVDASLADGVEVFEDDQSLDAGFGDVGDVPAASAFGSTRQAESAIPAPAHPSAGRAESSRLNPKYQFDTFVIGSSNRFAHAAAAAAAELPGRAYNPLFIYGESGLGKTHLLHAIGHYTRTLHTGTRVRYVSSEEFTNDFINSIRDDKASTFKSRYRDVDVLLIDDIQFLSGKVQTQEEFFHTFNSLYNANKQIVITSDLPPKQLQDFEDRMLSRFEQGLTTDVQPPDLETRIAILRKKSAADRLTVPPEVLEFVAGKISSNIRELEGALIRIMAFASLNRQPVDMDIASVVLKDLVVERSHQITSATIMHQTSAFFAITMDDLCSSSRSRVLVSARQIAMYLCRELTDLSLPKIGQQFGNRDHTTVMHADRKIRTLMAERRSVYNQVTELTSLIKKSSQQSM
ncbi:MAG: chromosomal replication initiator protein DnaA [Actinobacteria bacterium]|nr:chromosomal replication initiator protein DnaA [Actinomycetota bacterium]